MTRRAAVAAFLVALTLAMTGGSSSAAQRWSPIALSRDGHAWSRQLDAPLFLRNRHWVPGTSLVRTFYVRNQGRTKAVLSVSVGVRDRTGALSLPAFRLAVRPRHQLWHRVRAPGRTRTLVVDRGEVVPVAVRVRLMRRAGNRSMSRHATFTVHVRLTQRLKGEGKR